MKYGFLVKLVYLYFIKIMRKFLIMLQYVMKILAIIDNDTFKENFLNIAIRVAPFVNMIWYRTKEDNEEKVFNNCLLLRKNLHKSTLILSSYPRIARKANFNGVHLNSKTYNENIVTDYKDLIIGYSAHSIEECINIKSHYKTLSPIFAVNKPYYVSPLGIINAPCKNIYALGGVNLENYHLLKNCGFTGIAGISLCNYVEKLLSFN